MPVTVLAYSQDGRHVAVGGEDGEPIRVWEAASGKEAAEVTGLALFDVTFLHFSPDGTLLASGDNGGTSRLWIGPKGRPGKELLRSHVVDKVLRFQPRWQEHGNRQ